MGANLTTKTNIDAVVKQYLNGKLTLDELTPEQLKIIIQAVQIDDLKKDFSRKADLAQIDYEQERETFINNAGKTASKNTKITYSRSINLLEAWARKKGISILEMKPKDADDFIYSMLADKISPYTIHLNISACSSFFSFIERRYDFIRNPFRGTKARPKKKSVRALNVPTDAEISRIITTLKNPYKAATVIMIEQGLRVGALETMIIRDDRYTAFSKGKEISGVLTNESLKAIRKAKLDKKQPFRIITTEKIKDHFKYIAKKLHRSGQVSAIFSVHDLRHAFAIKHYTQDKDIYRLKEQLHHASIQVTENYLKGLKIND